MLNFFVTEESKIPAGMTEMYEPVEGGFQLKVNGAVSRDKLDEFRNNNIDLKKQLETIQETYKGVDIKEVEKNRELERKVREKQLLDAGKVDELVGERLKQQTEMMRNEYDSKLNGLTEENSVMSRQLETLLIDNTLRQAATEAGVLPSAIEDILLRGKVTFKLVNGQSVPMNTNGEVIYGRDANKPMTPSEWLQKLKPTAAHLFSQPKGSGATPFTGSGVDSGSMSAVDKISRGLANLK